MGKKSELTRERILQQGLELLSQDGLAGVTIGQVDNLQLTAAQEADLVNFLKVLTDGYGPITPVSFP
jgi:hypothetical protein